MSATFGPYLNESKTQVTWLLRCDLEGTATTKRLSAELYQRYFSSVTIQVMLCSPSNQPGIKYLSIRTGGAGISPGKEVAVNQYKISPVRSVQDHTETSSNADLFGWFQDRVMLSYGPKQPLSQALIWKTTPQNSIPLTNEPPLVLTSTGFEVTEVNQTTSVHFRDEGEVGKRSLPQFSVNYNLLHPQHPQWTWRLHYVNGVRIIPLPDMIFDNYKSSFTQDGTLILPEQAQAIKMAGLKGELTPLATHSLVPESECVWILPKEFKETVSFSFEVSQRLLFILGDSVFANLAKREVSLDIPFGLLGSK